MVVLALGVVSSALAFLAAHWFSEHKWDLLLWNVGYVIPLGAGLLGLAASSGLAAGMWVTGHRPGVRAFVLFGLQLVGAYVGYYYFQFRRLNPVGTVDAQGLPVTFWWFYDASTRAISTEKKDAVGLIGYAFRGLELAGFLAGGLIGAGLMALRPHCVPCARYRRTRVLGFVPAVEDVSAIVAQRADAPRLRQELATRGPASRWTEVRRLDERYLMRMIFCPRCLTGLLTAERLRGAFDQKHGSTVESHDVGTQVVRQLLL